MESFNFVLLLILQVSVAQYAKHQQIYEMYNNRNPQVQTGLAGFPSFALNPSYSLKVDSNYLNGPSSYGTLSEASQAPGQLPNTENSAEMIVIPNLDNILQQHLSDWRILQNIANSFFDSVTRFLESFVSSPTIFGKNSRNSILNPSNIDAINEIYMSFKYLILGILKNIANFIQSFKFVIQFYINYGPINIHDILGHIFKGFFKFWMF